MLQNVDDPTISQVDVENSMEFKCFCVKED